MNSVAKGTKSPVRWKTETVLGEAPTGVYNELPFNSETFDENIETVQSEDIQSNRENPAIRGGNIATRGTLTHDFTPSRVFPFFQQLLAGTVTTVPMTGGSDGVTNASTTFTSASAAFTPSMAGMHMFITGETEIFHIESVTDGTTVILDRPTTGTGTGVAFTIGAAASIPSTEYDRGTYTLSPDLSQVWVVTRGGTSGADLSALNTAGAAPGYEVVNGEVTFQYVGPKTKALYIHTIEPGPDFPPGGITFLKGIRGGKTDMWLRFLGSRISSLDLTVQQQGATKAAWNFLSQRSEKIDPASANGGLVTPEDFIVGLDAFVHLNDPTGGAGRVMKDFSLNFNNNLDETVFCIGERYRTDLPEGRKIATGRIGMYFLDSTEYDLFKGEVVIPLSLSIIHNGIYFRMDFPEVKLTGSGTPKISGQGAIMQNFDWTAFFQNESKKPGFVTLVDTKATPIS